MILYYNYCTLLKQLFCLGGLKLCNTFDDLKSFYNGTKNKV